MTVETSARFINELNENFPRPRDLIKEGDDHIRLVKSVLKNTFPGINTSVSMGSEKLNKIDSTTTFESDTLVINTELKVTGVVDFDENKLTNVGDPTEDTDAVTLGFLKAGGANFFWPINSIYTTVSPSDPADILGFGTWERFGEGRVIVGAGTGTDSNGFNKSFSANSKGGESQHQSRDVVHQPQPQNL